MYAPRFAKRMKTVVHTLAKPLLQTLAQTPANQFQTLVPLEGLIFSALKQRQAGWIQSRACFASLPFIYKSMAPLVGAYLLNIQIKGFPRNITKHTKRNMLRHSINPCGKPSFSSSPLRGTVGVNTNPFRFPLPLEGAGGWTQSKAFAPAKGYRLSPLAFL